MTLYFQKCKKRKSAFIFKPVECNWVLFICVSSYRKAALLKYSIKLYKKCSVSILSWVFYAFLLWRCNSIHAQYYFFFLSFTKTNFSTMRRIFANPYASRTLSVLNIKLRQRRFGPSCKFEGNYRFFFWSCHVSGFSNRKFCLV